MGVSLSDTNNMSVSLSDTNMGVSLSDTNSYHMFLFATNFNNHVCITQYLYPTSVKYCSGDLTGSPKAIITSIPKAIYRTSVCFLLGFNLLLHSKIPSCASCLLLPIRINLLTCFKLQSTQNLCY